jgi:hypothetical protein
MHLREISPAGMGVAKEKSAGVGFLVDPHGEAVNS